MKTARCSTWLMVWLAAALIAKPASADAPLRWKFAKGQTLSYTMSESSVKTIEILGKQPDPNAPNDAGKAESQPKKFQTTLTQTIDMTWTVQDVEPDGSARMNQTINRIRLSSETPFGGKLSIDTNDKGEPKNPAAIGLMPILRATVGAPVAVTMSNRGEIRDVTLPPDLLASLKDTGPAGAAAGSLISEDALRKAMSRGSLILPETAVAKGASWTVNAALPAPFGTMSMTSTYTDQGAANRGETAVERIGVKVEHEIKPKEEAPVQAKILTQDGQGTIDFDAKSGRLAGSKVVLKVKLALNAMGVEATEDNQTTVTMEPTKASGEANPAK
ncbi:MAG: DUF6263 family protein [Isosphaeraceae bacterium]